MSSWYERKKPPSHFSEGDYAPAFGGEDFGGIGGPVNWLHPGAPARHTGVGPKNYKRADESILDDIVMELTHHPRIDATHVEVQVENGEVRLSGTVTTREMKQLAEEAADSVSGVSYVHNRIRVKADDWQHAA